MQFHRVLLRGTLLAVALTVSTAAISSAAMAQGGTVNFQIAFTGHVDCHRPFAINGVPISGSGTGTISTDGNVTADITETAFVLSSRIHFDGRLGARRHRASARGREKSPAADLELAEQSDGGQCYGQWQFLLGELRGQSEARKDRVHAVRRQHLSLLRPAERRNVELPSPLKVR
jgi:hypothetical protein